MTTTFRAGAARLSLEPPLGLPMVGYELTACALPSPSCPARRQSGAS